MNRVTEQRGYFGPGPVWQVQGDPSMVVAGLRALLLQAVHPVVMGGFDANTDVWSDPWGRLARTGEYVATVAFGAKSEADKVAARVRRIHAACAPYVDPDTGAQTPIDDPDLLLWVHVTEAESFLRVHLQSGGQLTDDEIDDYYLAMRRAARLIGIDPRRVPGSASAVERYYEDVRSELSVTPAARWNVARGIIPPMPTWVAFGTPARPAWAGLIAIAAGLLPGWAKELYGLPALLFPESAAVTAARVVRSAVASLPNGLGESPMRRSAYERIGTPPPPIDVPVAPAAVTEAIAGIISVVGHLVR